MTHLQEVLLMIAKDIDALFKENGIKYFLDGGTALGAVRHRGFIPWDDDYDIIILPEDYIDMVNICRNKLDRSKYEFEEAMVDRFSHISKIKLKDTHIKEVDAISELSDGIYIDIFTFDIGRRSKIGRFFQFIMGRLWVSYLLSKKRYTTKSVKKKIAITFSRVLNCNSIQKIVNQIRRPTYYDKWLSMTWARSRNNWNRYFCKKELFSQVLYVQFEDTVLPVCNGYDEYLKICFGDYKTLPPEEKRKGMHITDVDFGKY